MTTSKRIRVLIVDDHASVRDGIRAFLEAKTPFTICGEAADGAQAIQQSQALRPDVIILDLALPMLNGVEVASVLRSELPDVRILAFSMYANELGRALRAATKIDAVLPKSASLSMVVETIENLVGAPAPLPSSAPGPQAAPSA